MGISTLNAESPEQRAEIVKWRARAERARAEALAHYNAALTAIEAGLAREIERVRSGSIPVDLEPPTKREPTSPPPAPKPPSPPPLEPPTWQPAGSPATPHGAAAARPLSPRQARPQGRP